MDLSSNAHSSYTLPFKFNLWLHPAVFILRAYLGFKSVIPTPLYFSGSHYNSFPGLMKLNSLEKNTLIVFLTHLLNPYLQMNHFLRTTLNNVIPLTKDLLLFSHKEIWAACKVPISLCIWSLITLSRQWHWLPSLFSADLVTCPVVRTLLCCSLYQHHPVSKCLFASFFIMFSPVLFSQWCSSSSIWHSFVLYKASTCSHLSSQDPCVFTARDATDRTVGLWVFLLCVTCFPGRLYSPVIACSAACGHHKSSTVC